MSFKKMYEEFLACELTRDFTNMFQLFPSLEALKTTPQDPFYHAEGDVWTHTVMVMNALLDMEEYQQAHINDRFCMFYAALLHDISKPTCTKHEEDGRITSKGHSRMGAIDARVMLWKYNVPFILREEICNIIAVHQVPFFAFDDKGNETRAARTPEFIAIQLSHNVLLRNLIVVATADMIGRYCEVKQKALDDISLFAELAKELDCYYWAYEFPNDVTKYEYFQRNGTIDANSLFYKRCKCIVHVMSGLPASGKDTFIKQHLPDLPVVSYDDAKKELGLTHKDNPGQAVQLVLSKAKEYLASGTEFVWNATHVSKQMREKTLNLLNQYDAYIIFHYVETDVNTLFSRNEQRNAQVPKDFYDKLFTKWEVPLNTDAHLVMFYVGKYHNRLRYIGSFEDIDF